MDISSYYEMIISLLIWLTFVVLFLIFMYMVYTKEERTTISEARAYKVLSILTRRLGS